MPATAIGLFFIGAALLAFAGLLAYSAFKAGRDRWDLLDVEVRHWQDVDPTTLIEDQWVGDDLTPLFDQDDGAA